MVVAYDPAAIEHARAELPPGLVTYVDSAYEAARGADALLILTEWEEFGNLNLTRIRELLRYPILVDGRNLYDPQRVIEEGLYYISVGRPEAVPTGLPVQNPPRPRTFTLGG